MVKFKMWFVQIWHDLVPGKYCWADCVSWAYGSRWNPFKIESSSGCITESKEHKDGCCYCGMCHKGVHWDTLSKEAQAKILKQRDEQSIRDRIFNNNDSLI